MFKQLTRAAAACAALWLLSGCAGPGTYPLTGSSAQPGDPVLSMQAGDYSIPPAAF